ncbi:MAG: beta-phosphoglucomutase family hydrolase [Chitinophagaceae bacterium]|nr:MAG: beta-phosphoglucomutase family hydrolase [Chitinophagaceae bacterium]
MKYKAFLFDLNGTMIDDMDYHIDAWFNIVNNLGAGLTRDRMKSECYGKNHELLERIFPGRFSEQEKITMSIEKEEAYQEGFRPQLKLISGLDKTLEKAKAAGIKMAIGSAAITFNIDFVLDGLGIRHYFDAIVSADDVTKSKPDPETFLRCAEHLGVHPSECLVFEDVPKGVESARSAGMDALVILGIHTADEFGVYENVISLQQDYELLAW